MWKRMDLEPWGKSGPLARYHVMHNFCAVVKLNPGLNWFPLFFSKENDRVSSDARQNVTVKGECYVPHLTEVEVSNSSIDYQHQYYPVSATLHVDPVLSAPGNEEARPGPSAAVIARRIGNQPYYKHSTVVQSAGEISLISLLVSFCVTLI